MVTFALGPREVYVFGLLHGVAIGMCFGILAVLVQARREGRQGDKATGGQGDADGR